MSNPGIRATVTTHSVLGLLADRPGSAYALARRMEINLAVFWPAARSHVYTEVRKLQALGWAASNAPEGPRKRVEYRITPEGQAALSAWLATRPATFAVEMEGLVRVFLAASGRREDLLLALQSLHDEAEAMLRLAGVIVPAYLRGEGPYPEHIHLRALMIDFLTHFAALTRDWAARSLAVVGTWSDLDGDGKELWARACLGGVPRIEG